MSQSVVVIAEEALLEADARHIIGLSEPQTAFRLLVPTANRNVVTAFLDNLAILDLKEAWEDLIGRNDVSPDEARATAGEALARSVEVLTEAGCDVVTASIAEDVIAALRAEIAEAGDVLQVIVITQQHAVEDTFHRNWADRAHEELGLPVLHLYRGTSTIGS